MPGNDPLRERSVVIPLSTPAGSESLVEVSENMRGRIFAVRKVRGPLGRTKERAKGTG